MPTPTEWLAYDKAELEFLISKCFISGFGSRLAGLAADVTFFFQPMSPAFIAALKKGGAQNISTNSEESRVSAYDNFNVLSSTYEQLPWDDLIVHTGEPLYKIYYPFAATKYIFREFMQNELPKTLSDPKIKPQEHIDLMENIRFLRECSQTLEKTLAEFRGAIKKATGEEAPRFSPAFEIHRNPERYAGVLY